MTSFWQNTHYSIRTLGLTPRLSILGDEFKKEVPPIGVAYQVANALQLPLELLTLPHSEFKDELSSFRKTKDEIPEKYLLGGLSKRRSALNIIDFIDKSLGSNYSQYILNHFGISLSALKKEDELISVRLPIDIVTLVHELRDEPSFVVQMGYNSFSTHKKSPLGKAAANTKSLPNLFEYMFYEGIQKWVERNYE